MTKNLARKGLLVIATALLAAIGFAAPASATDSMTWHPQTPAGGQPAAPGYWDSQALIRLNGPGSSVTNVTLAPQFVTSTSSTTSTSYTTAPVYDYSTPVTNVAGGQSNTAVTTNATVESGSVSTSVTTAGSSGK